MFTAEKVTGKFNEAHSILNKRNLNLPKSLNIISVLLIITTYAN